MQPKLGRLSIALGGAVPRGEQVASVCPIEELEGSPTYVVDVPTGSVFWLEDRGLVEAPIQGGESADLAASAFVDFDRIEHDRAARDRKIQAILLEREGEADSAARARGLAAEMRRRADRESELSAFAFPDGAPLVRDAFGTRVPP